jgi:hypothetical protein
LVRDKIRKEKEGWRESEKTEGEVGKSDERE